MARAHAPTVFVFAIALVACSQSPAPKAADPTPADVHDEVATLGIPACTEYVAVLEQECFGARTGALPAPLGALMADRVETWKRHAVSPAGRAEVAEGCASAREALRTFRCSFR